MGLGVGRVDHLNVGCVATLRQFPEQAFPDAALRPAHEAVIDRFRRPILGRTIDPAATALDDMHDAADDTAVVDAIFAAHVRRQKRLYPRPLPITKPKQVATHRLAPNQTLKANHQPIQSAMNLLGPHPSVSLLLGAMELFRFLPSTMTQISQFI